MTRGKTMISFRKVRVVIMLQFLLALLAVNASAQVTTGNVRGIVKDPTGAVIQNASVTITDPVKQTTQTATTTGGGEFQFHNLLPGTYTVKVEAQGFSVANIEDVRVQLNETTDLPVQLQLGATTATVNVSAAGAEL